MNWDGFRDPVLGAGVKPGRDRVLSSETIEGEVARLSDLYPSRVLELRRPAAGVDRLTFFPHPWWPAVSTLPGAEVWVTLHDEGWTALDLAGSRIGSRHWQVSLHDRLGRSYAATLARSVDEFHPEAIAGFTRLPFGFQVRPIEGDDKVVPVRDLPEPVFVAGVAEWAVQLGFEPRWPPES